MKKLNKDYFLSNDDEVVQFGRHKISVNYNSILSTKVLNFLYNIGKPYVILEEEDVDPIKEVIKEAKLNIKSKKKVKIDEPKKSKPETRITDSNKKES